MEYCIKNIKGQITISSGETCFSGGEEGKLTFLSTLSSRIHNRVIDAIIIERINGSFTCNGSPSYHYSFLFLCSFPTFAKVLFFFDGFLIIGDVSTLHFPQKSLLAHHRLLQVY